MTARREPYVDDGTLGINLPPEQQAYDGPPDAPVDPALARAALEVAIRAARKDEAYKAYQAVRASAEALFAQARNRGVPQVELRLPDGTKLGLISIRKGADVWTVDEDTLAAVAAGNDPADFEDVIDPKALRDRNVIDLIAAHYPDLVTARISPVARARYQREWEENGGKITDQSIGERVQVAEVEHMPATGEFAYRPASKAATLIDEAIAAGLINEWGEIAADEETPDVPRPGAGTDEASADPPGPGHPDDTGQRLERARESLDRQAKAARSRRTAK